jgi:lambda family phage portal protein
MNWLDTLINELAPAWGAARARKRLELYGYEAANPSRTHKATREHRNGNQAVFAAGRSLREQARWLDENHDIVIGLLDKMEERIVGARGIQIEPQPMTLGGDIHEELAATIRERWAEWSLRPEVTGRMSRPEMERLVARTWLRDGEVFGQLLQGRVPGYQYATATPFAIELLEPDFVPYELNEPGNNIRQGCRLNAWGRILGYQVLYDHPGDLGMRHKTKEIPAERMLHLALVKRLHQLRGVSLLHGIITRLADLKDVEESERVAARISAALAFFIRKGTADMYSPPDSSQPQAPREFPIAPGMTFDDLRQGEEVGSIQSNRPNVALNIWREGQLRSAAAGARSGYSSIARDYDGTYSAQRQELVEQFEGFAVLQDAFVAQWSRPVYRHWLAMDIAAGGIKLPKDVDRNSLFNALYLAPVMPWIDPAKESKGWRDQIRGGAASESEWIRARGRNPDEVRRQRVADKDFNRNHQIITDTDPANDRGQNEPSNPSSEPTDEPESGRRRRRQR